MVAPLSTASEGGWGQASPPVERSVVCLPQVEQRGWAPTILLCLAVVLSAALIVVAKPLTAAASTGVHAHGIAVRPAHAQKVSEVAPPGVQTSPNWSGYVAYAPAGNDSGFSQVSAEW